MQGLLPLDHLGDLLKGTGTQRRTARPHHGWTILVAIDHLIAAVSVPAFVLLAAGGVLYSVGVLFHRWDRLLYNRAVWDGFVLTGAACQSFAVLDVVAS